MRIWVARPEPGAARTAKRLRSLGHEPLVAPVLRVGSTGEPMPPGAFAAALLTSAHAVEALAASPLERGLPVLAVGARTAGRAREAGFADVREAQGDAAALVRLVRASMPAGTRLLHVAGADRKREPGASLIAAGYALTVWQAYAARPVEAFPTSVAQALSEAPLAVLHYSRRSAATALALAREARLEAAFAGFAHFCLSPDVAVPLVEAGIVAHFVAAQPNEDALLAGLPVPP